MWSFAFVLILVILRSPLEVSSENSFKPNSIELFKDTNKYPNITLTDKSHWYSSSTQTADSERIQSGLTLLHNVYKEVTHVFRGCEGRLGCYRKKILRGLDRAIDAESLKIADGVFLVKEDHEEFRQSVFPRESDQDSFLVSAARRIIYILETHALRVRLGVMKDAVGQARIGHHGYRSAFPMMVGAFMLLASFMVPMGFQFLAVVGGKALILSQIAMVMAMGGTLQRYFGLRGGNYPPPPAPAVPVLPGGLVQHEYFLSRKDPLHRTALEGVEAEEFETGRPSYQLIPPPSQLSHHQLYGFMHQHPTSSSSTSSTSS